MTIPFVNARRLVTLSAAMLLLSQVGAKAAAAEGALATTWPGGFAASTAVAGASDSMGQAVAVQADGRTVVAGWATIGGNKTLVLARYTVAGALDGTFGTGGIVIDSGLSPSDQGYYVALQASGAIDVAGYQTVSGHNAAAVVQYTAAGARDATFNGNGVAASLSGVAFLTNSTDVVFNSLAVQSDGKVVAVGRYADFASGKFVAFVARYTAAGAVDTSFAGNGAVSVTPTSAGTFIGNGFANHVVLQGDGAVLCCGTITIGTTDDVMAFRLTKDGIVDNSFGQNGSIVISTLAGNSKGTYIDLQGDGKSVVGGSTIVSSANRFLALRLNASGQLDSTYGNGGIVVLPSLGGSDEQGTALAVQWDGKAVLYGQSTVVPDVDLAVVRLTATGAMDATFGTAGKTITSLASGAVATNGALISADTANGVAGPNANHQLVVTGRDGNNRLFAARYVLDTTAPVSAITAPATGSTTNHSNPTLSGTSEPYATVTISDGGAAVGTATTSATGAWTLAATSTLAAGTHTLTASALDAAGNTGAASTPVALTVDLTPPTMLSATAAAASSAAAPFVFTVTFSEAVASLNASALQVVNGNSVVTAATANPAIWSVTVTPLTAGPVTVTIPAGAYKDLAGNANTDTRTVSEQYTGAGTTTTAGATTGTPGTPVGGIDYGAGGAGKSKCGLGGGLVGVLLAIAALRRRRARAG
jgi:uncharacterized delta-60 repeat protein